MTRRNTIFEIVSARLIAVSLIVCSAAFSAALAENNAIELTRLDCHQELDSLVAEASNDASYPHPIEQPLETLEAVCENLPQIAHNRGVMAARAERWPEAISHFERALDLDERASSTHQHLQRIFEHRAATAYARAFNRPVQLPRPTFELQDSTRHNADLHNRQEQSAELHSISTVEYELFAWWQAHQSKEDVAQYYVSDYPAAAIKLSTQEYTDKPWNNMQREIAFTAKDAVVVLRDTKQRRTLLLLRLVGTRWKIYQETSL